MIEIFRPLPSQIKGAVFDMDDTLLDNRTPEGFNLHGISRLAAIHEIGAKYDVPYLANLTIERSHEAFAQAKEHTVDGATWNVLVWAGVVPSIDEIDHTHHLVKAISNSKYKIHEDLLRKEGKALPFACEFVRGLHARIPGKMAIATGAIRNEVDIFLKLSRMSDYFEDRVVTINDVTHPKPHEEPFIKGFQTLGLSDEYRSNVVAFEDDPQGIASAHSAGLFPIAITTRHELAIFEQSTIKPGIVADSYEEFAELFEINIRTQIN